eukprot:1159306-Pelagomonas_calceolata.AAC.7
MAMSWQRRALQAWVCKPGHGITWQGKESMRRALQASTREGEHERGSAGKHKWAMAWQRRAHGREELCRHGVVSHGMKWYGRGREHEKGSAGMQLWTMASGAWIREEKKKTYASQTCCVQYGKGF